MPPYPLPEPEIRQWLQQLRQLPPDLRALFLRHIEEMQENSDAPQHQESNVIALHR